MLKNIRPFLPPPEERAEIRRKLDEDRAIFLAKQREIRKEYHEKKESQQNS